MGIFGDVFGGLKDIVTSIPPEISVPIAEGLATRIGGGPPDVVFNVPAASPGPVTPLPPQVGIPFGGIPTGGGITPAAVPAPAIAGGAGALGGALVGGGLRALEGMISGGSGLPFGGLLFREVPGRVRAKRRVEFTDSMGQRHVWMRVPRNAVGSPIAFSGDVSACRRLKRARSRIHRAIGSGRRKG